MVIVLLAAGGKILQAQPPAINLGGTGSLILTPPVMTAAVAQTNALVNSLAMQQFQRTAAQAANAAYLAKSSTNQTLFPGIGSSVALGAQHLNQPALAGIRFALDDLALSTPLLDLNFGASDSAKVGFAAIGLTDSDFWNGITLNWQSSATISDVAWADGTSSGINVTVNNAPGGWGNSTGDGMYDSFIYPWDGGSIAVTLNNVPAGSYDFYLYGHSQLPWDNTQFQINVGTFNTPVAETQDSSYAASSDNWASGVQYVAFTNVPVSCGQPVVITCSPGDGTAILNGLQMISDDSGTPIIGTQPASQCFFVGSTAALSVSAYGESPLSYQWQQNGTNLAGAVNDTLSFNNVQLGNAGTYTVVVSNPAGSVTSSSADLTVLSAYSAVLDVNIGSGTKVGFAATGLTTNDYWNGYDLTSGSVKQLEWADGYTNASQPITICVSNAPGGWGNSTGDPMYDSFRYPWDGGSVYILLTNMPANTYNFYLYGHSQQAWDNTVFEITVGTNVTPAEATQDSDFAASSSNWVENAQYVVFRGVSVPDGQPVLITGSPGDGTAILNGMQILLPMPSDTTDRDGNGLPDNWEIYYFGHIGLDPNSTDGQGNTLLYDCNNGLDPNVISFTVESANQYDNLPFANLQLNITAGTPSYYALVINGQTTTNWLPFVSTNLTVPLGSTDGVYDVSIGLRGLPPNATQTWENYSLTLDTVPPMVTITSPSLGGGVVKKPYLQLQGFANKPLASLSYDISNAFGLATNQNAFVTGQTFDQNQFDFTTNFFQAYDVPLATNDNFITLCVTDRAGNTTTTNFDVVLDYSGATNPPVVNLIWPTNGMTVSGSSCTIQGTMSDETGTIVAQIVDSDGNSNTLTGIVERNGMFWVENVPLNGTNQISLQAVDAAGKVTTTNFTVIKSDVILTIDSTPTGVGLYQVSGSVTGTVSDPTATVTVNGVAATVDATDYGDGLYNWSADDVPIYGQGTATFNAVASVPGQTPALSLLEVEKDAEVVITTYHVSKNASITNNTESNSYGRTKDYYAKYGTNSAGQWGLTNYQGTLTELYQYQNINNSNANMWQQNTAIWSDLGDEMSVSNRNGTNLVGTSYNYPFIYDDDYGQFTGLPDEDLWQYGSEGEALPQWFYHYWALNVHQTINIGDWVGNVAVGARTELTLFTGGKSLVNRQNLIQLRCGATEYGNVWAGATWPNSPWVGAPAWPINSGLRALGRNVGSDGNLWVALPDNAAFILNLSAPAQHYDAWATPTKYDLRVHTLTMNGNACHSLVRDNGSAYPSANCYVSLSGNILAEYPALYESQSWYSPAPPPYGSAPTLVGGNQMMASTAFTVLSGGSAHLLVRGVATGGGNSYTFTGENDLSFGGITDWTVQTTADNPIPTAMVDYYNPLTINWSYSVPGFNGWVDAGTTACPIYISLLPPITSALNHTVVHLACSQGHATTEAQAVANTWGQFSGLGVTTWNGQKMYYYNPYDNKPAMPHVTGGPTKDSLGGLLGPPDNPLFQIPHNGDCTAWTDFLIACLGVNGVDASVQEVRKNRKYFVVNNCAFVQELQTGKYKIPPPPSQSPPPNGVPGQNTPANSSPAQKFFNIHRIVKLPASCALNCSAIYLDPSYGISAIDALDYTRKAIAGWEDPNNTDSNDNFPGTYWIIQTNAPDECMDF